MDAVQFCEIDEDGIGMRVVTRKYLRQRIQINMSKHNNNSLSENIFMKWNAQWPGCCRATEQSEQKP